MLYNRCSSASTTAPAQCPSATSCRACRLFKTPFARGAHRDAHWAVIGGMRCVAKLYLGLGGGLQETLAALHEVHNLSRGMMNIALEMGV